SNYTFNIAVVQSRDLDSDGDGIVNADDPTPFLEPETMGLLISMTASQPHHAVLTWRAMPRSTNRVEYLSSIGATNWLMLTNIINGPTNGTLKAMDPSSMSSQRFYRVREDPRK